MKRIIALTIVIAITATTPAVAKRIHKESWYQDAWCTKYNGITEYKLKDRTRVDCLTKTHAIEHDFANKWAEAVGQSLHYARLTGKKAGIALIVEKSREERYYRQLIKNVKFYDLPIDIWKIKGY